jgi:hypothetical protein
MTDTRVIKVAVPVTATTQPKDLIRILDLAFEDWDDVVQFAVEDYGWDGKYEGLDLAVRMLRAASGPPCVVCGGPIWGRSRRAIVCGDECRKKRNRQLRKARSR